MDAATPSARSRAGAASAPPFEIDPLGDSALVVRVGTQIDEATRRRVLGVTRALESATLPGSAEIVPGYTTVTVHYDPCRLDGQPGAPLDVIRGQVSIALAAPLDINGLETNHIEIPVCYGEEFGPDLDLVATGAGLAPGEIIERHTAGEYRVHLLGFLPGFAYLGGLDPRLATPRRDTPRTTVPAGSVGIGGMQTGVYPLESPGGWQLIGRSPVTLFDPGRSPPAALAPGDIVHFRAIDRSEYDGLLGTLP